MARSKVAVSLESSTLRRLDQERSGTVIAVALTSQAPMGGFPLTLELSAPDLPERL